MSGVLEKSLNFTHDYSGNPECRVRNSNSTQGGSKMCATKLGTTASDIEMREFFHWRSDLQ